MLYINQIERVLRQIYMRRLKGQWEGSGRKNGKIGSEGVKIKFEVKRETLDLGQEQN